MTTAAKKAASKKAEPKPETEDKPKRKSFTPEEKIAKLEADLAEARVKAAEKKQKAIDDKSADKAKLQEKIDDLRLKMAELDAEIAGLTEGGSITGEDLEAGDDPIAAASEEAVAAATADSD